MDANNHIADSRTRAFVAALRAFEQDGDPTALVGQFGAGATAARMDARGPRTDVEAFWREYRAQFDRVSTTFRNAVEGPEQVALEWDSDTVLTGGQPATIRGVTVLDLSTEPDAGAIAALRTYYDTAAFVVAPTANT